MNIVFNKGLPYRSYGLYSILISEWCILGDCMQPECHHCYPVKDCKKHHLCKKEGTCKSIPIPKEKLNKL